MSSLYRILSLVTCLTAGGMLLAPQAFADASPTGCKNSGGKAAGCLSVPEVSANGAASALMLAVGGAAVIAGRRRRRAS